MKRLAPLAAWTVLAVTLLLGVGWGAHAPHSWDVDNIAPGSVLRAMAAKFGPGWWSSYGPVPYLMVGVIYAPMLLAFRLAGELGVPVAEFPWGFRHPETSVGALIVAARLLTVALALMLVWLAVRERKGETPRARWLVPLLFAGSPVFVFYARTTNVDLHYFFFLACAFHFAGRAAWWSGLVAGAAAALAVASKEQAAPIACAAALAAAWRAFSSGGPLAERLRGAALVALGAVGAYAIAWGLPFNASGWSEHHRFLFEQARYPRDFDTSPAGWAGLAGLTGALLPLALGWPILAGAVLALPRRSSWSGLGSRALALILYAAGFLAVVGYVYPRFLLPVLLLALPLAVRGWSGVLDRGGVVAKGALVALLALVAIGGPLLGIAQLRDSRYRAAEWLARYQSSAPRGASPRTAQVVGNPRFQVRVPGGFAATAIAIDTLSRVTSGPTADVVLLSSFDRYRIENDPALRARWLDVLESGTGPYRLAADVPPPRWSRLVRGLPFSPVIWIWVRRAPAGALNAAGT